MAQQKTEFEKKKEEDMVAQYKKEQDMYENRALLGDEKAKLGLSFMYDAPPGLKKAEKEKEEGEPEYKFEWQRKFNAPREQYAKNDETIRDQPFGIEVRNVRCIKCRTWGHVNTDRICPLFGKDLAAEPPQPKTSASSLLESMREDGFTLKKSLLGKMANPKADNEQLLPSDDEDDPEVKFLKSLTAKQKKKLLKKLDRLQKGQSGGRVEKKKKRKKDKKSKKKKHNSESSDDEHHSRKQKRSSKKRKESSDSSSSGSDEEQSERKQKHRNSGASSSPEKNTHSRYETRGTDYEHRTSNRDKRKDCQWYEKDNSQDDERDTYRAHQGRNKHDRSVEDNDMNSRKDRKQERSVEYKDMDSRKDRKQERSVEDRDIGSRRDRMRDMSVEYKDMEFRKDRKRDGSVEDNDIYSRKDRKRERSVENREVDSRRDRKQDRSYDERENRKRRSGSVEKYDRKDGNDRSGKVRDIKSRSRSPLVHKDGHRYQRSSTERSDRRHKDDQKRTERQKRKTSSHSNSDSSDDSGNETRNSGDGHSKSFTPKDRGSRHGRHERQRDSDDDRGRKYGRKSQDRHEERQKKTRHQSGDSSSDSG